MSGIGWDDYNDCPLWQFTEDELAEHDKQIRIKTIDEFVSEIKKHHYLLCNKNNSTDYGMFTCGLEQIASELKRGVEE